MIEWLQNALLILSLIQHLTHHHCFFIFTQHNQISLLTTLLKIKCFSKGFVYFSWTCRKYSPEVCLSGSMYCQCTNFSLHSPLTPSGGSGVAIAVIIICLLLIAILGSVLYYLYKKGKLPCGRSGKQDLYVLFFMKKKKSKLLINCLYVIFYTY